MINSCVAVEGEGLQKEERVTLEMNKNQLIEDRKMAQFRNSLSAAILYHAVCDCSILFEDRDAIVIGLGENMSP